MLRVAVGGIMHESNTFVSIPTDLEAFAVSTGDQIRPTWGPTFHEMAGFLAGCDQLDLTVVPTLMASATPAGTVTARAFDALTDELCSRIQSAGALDGVLLAVHGAMVSAGHPDGDGEIIRRVRETIGPDVPLVVTHDFHANVSPRMVAGANATVIYKTNPHLDQRARGIQAAEVMNRILRHGVVPVQHLAAPPMVWNILHQYTRHEPLASILREAAEWEARPEFLAVNVAAGFPYADVEEMGPSVVVATDNRPDLAREVSELLATRLWDEREKIRIAIPEPAEAVRLASASAQTPVILVEFGDNIGGGSPGDCTFVLEEMVRQEAPGGVCVLYDPENAAVCAAAGIGEGVTLEVGGKKDASSGKPVPLRGRVKSLHDGRFRETEARHGGQTDWDQGLTAVVELPTGTLVVLNSRRTAPMSLHQLTSLGIRPELQQMIVVKAAIAYRAAYEPIAGSIQEVDSPGVTAVNPVRFTYHRRRRPLWPLD